MFALVWPCSGGLCGKGAVFHMVYQPVPHSHLSHAAPGAAKSALKTEPATYGDDSGHALRPVQDHHRGPGGGNGAHPGTFAAGDDLQSAGTGEHRGLYLRPGLANGACLPGDHSDRDRGGFSEQQDLRRPLAGCCGGGPPHGKCHCGVCGRHPGGQGVQPVRRVLQAVFRCRDGQRPILCGLDGGQPEVYGGHAGGHPLGAAARSAGGSAAVGRWKFEHSCIPHHRRAVPGAYRTDGIGHDLCG